MKLLPLARLKGRIEARADFQKQVLKCKNSNYQCGDICIPRRKKCNLSKAQIEKKIHEAENKIKDLPIEYGVVLDSQGNIVYSKQGEQTSVHFEPEESMKMKGMILTHNHPNVYGFPESDIRSKGCGFSINDLEFASHWQLKEIRAVSNGYRHSLQPPPTGWSPSFREYRLKPTYEKYENQVQSEFRQKLFFGSMSREEAYVNYHHEIAKRTAKELKMIYKREEIKNG